MQASCAVGTPCSTIVLSHGSGVPGSFPAWHPVPIPHVPHTHTIAPSATPFDLLGVCLEDPKKPIPMFQSGNHLFGSIFRLHVGSLGRHGHSAIQDTDSFSRIYPLRVKTHGRGPFYLGFFARVLHLSWGIKCRPSCFAKNERANLLLLHGFLFIIRGHLTTQLLSNHLYLYLDSCIPLHDTDLEKSGVGCRIYPRRWDERAVLKIVHFPRGSSGQHQLSLSGPISLCLRHIY